MSDPGDHYALAGDKIVLTHEGNTTTLTFNDKGIGRECDGCQAAEVWREHPRLPGLWVSNLGKARSSAREITQRNRWGGMNTVRLPARDHKLTPDSRGYPVVGFEGRQYRVHVLMLECFVGPRPELKFHGCHRDDCHSHNCLKNLRWDTPKGNRADVMSRNAQGRMYGKANPLTRIPTSIVWRIRRLALTHRTGRSIAGQFGISEAQVSRISRGLSRTQS